MKRKVQTGLLLLCLTGSLFASACSGAGLKSRDKEYQAAVKIYNEELSKDRVPWITPEGTETSISTRAFKFAVLDINPGKLPDLLLLKDTGRNLSDDGTYLLDTCYSESAFQVMEMLEPIRYYPDTGIYVIGRYGENEDGSTYSYDSNNQKFSGKTESYYYLPDCSQEDEDSLYSGLLSGMTMPIACCDIREDQEEPDYTWYGFYDGKNYEEYKQHIAEDCSVSKEEFDKKLKEYTGDTEPITISAEDFYDNTEENRNKYLS